MEIIEKELKEEKLDKLYNDIEAPLIHVLTEIEYNGIRLDSDFLNKYSKELEKLVKKAEKKIYKEAGIEFNTPLELKDWEPVDDAEVGSETDSPPTLVSTVEDAEVEAEAAFPPTLVTTKDPVSTLALGVKYEADNFPDWSSREVNFSPSLTRNR